MKNLNIDDIKKMFSYIRLNKKRLLEILKLHEECAEAKIALDEVNVKYSNLELQKNSYLIPDENLDLWDGEDNRVFDERYCYLLSESDLDKLLRNVYNEIKDDKIFNKYLPDHAQIENVYHLVYSEKFRAKKLEIERSLINEFEKFTSFKQSDLYVIAHHNSYISWLLQCIKEFK